MGRRLVPVVAVVLAASLILGACSKSSPSAASGSVSVPTLPSVAPPTSEAGSNPTSDFCTALKVEKAKLNALTSNLGTAVDPTDLATTKKNLATYMAAVTQAVVEVESTMSAAPADVQAALQVFNTYLQALPDRIKNATTMAGLADAFQGMDTPEMKSASKTLSAYAKSQCGTLSSPTP
jgi:hypothetical protein